MNKKSKSRSTLSYYSSDESAEDFEFSQKCVVTPCECNEIDDKTDNIIADLENQLRKSEMDLIFANEKIALYDDKIKDKNDIIEALKMTNSLLKSENKDKIDTQAVAIRRLQEELSQKNKEKLARNNDSLEKKLKSYQIKEEDNKKLIATLEAQIKAKDDQISVLELGQNLDNCKIKEKDDLLKDQAAIIKEMEIEIKLRRSFPIPKRLTLAQLLELRKLNITKNNNNK